jgi:DNA-binding beta-propeller fold protein YncE
MKYPLLVLGITVLTCSLSAQDLEFRRIPVGTRSVPETSEIRLTLIARIQSYNSYVKNGNDIYDRSIGSPKSAIILEEKNKFYINNLENKSTAVYDLNTCGLLKNIKHKFTGGNSYLFKDTSVFDYMFHTRNSQFNIFQGKPVEGCLSHNKKYLWVTYYRRTYDINAVDPSALAIIDTDKDEIVRVMPTGPLPKMIACSPDNRFIAVTHWGDNTIGIIDISSNDVDSFKYIKLFEVGKRRNLTYDNKTKIDRDKDCGYCLRGTVFSPDSKYLLVARMGGGGIAVFDMTSMKYIRSVFGMQSNIRHLAVNGDQLYISTNITGYVQTTNIYDLIDAAINSKNDYINWKSCYVGQGARTISVSEDGKYIFAAVNNESKVSVIRVYDMNIIATVIADSFPVGMDIAHENAKLIVTSQGRISYGGGQSVMIYKITKGEKETEKGTAP